RADRLVAEVPLARKGFVHDRDRGRACVVEVREYAPAQQRNAERIEISRADRRYGCVSVGARSGLDAFDGEVASEGEVVEQRDAGGADAADARLGCKRLLDAIVEHEEPRLIVRAQLRRDAERDEGVDL